MGLKDLAPAEQRHANGWYLLGAWGRLLRLPDGRTVVPYEMIDRSRWRCALLRTPMPCETTVVVEPDVILNSVEIEVPRHR